jgi:DNA-binding NarL/FixJ family response regulator
MLGWFAAALLQGYRYAGRPSQQSGAISVREIVAAHRAMVGQSSAVSSSLARNAASIMQAHEATMHGVMVATTPCESVVTVCVSEGPLGAK